MRQLHGCVYLKVTNGRVKVAPNPDYFIPEDLKARSSKVKSEMEEAKKWNQ